MKQHQNESVPLVGSLAGHLESTDADRPPLLLSVIVQGVSVGAHMFTADEIEFDIVREVMNLLRFAAVVRFMNFAANTVQRVVLPNLLPFGATVGRQRIPDH